MLGRSGLIAALLLFSVCTAPAQTPTPTSDATAAARSLVTTMKMGEQFKALLPVIMQGLKPALVQNRPEVERDFDAMMPMMLEAFTPYYSAIVDGIVAVYASNFTAQELRDIEAFYRQPAGQKLLAKTQTIMQQSMQVGQGFGQQAAEDLRQRMTDELRKKGHKI
ncbi:MAG: DUF2059 domain-containing protein [Xanthobacteraceae bacterium]